MRASIIFISLALLSGVACHEKPAAHSGKLTQANLDKIQKGMTIADVEAILGDNDTRKPGLVSVGGADVTSDERTWKEGDQSIVVDFVGGETVSSTGSNLP